MFVAKATKERQWVLSRVHNLLLCTLGIMSCFNSVYIDGAVIMKTCLWCLQKQPFQSTAIFSVQKLACLLMLTGHTYVYHLMLW